MCALSALSNERHHPTSSEILEGHDDKEVSCGVVSRLRLLQISIVLTRVGLPVQKWTSRFIPQDPWIGGFNAHGIHVFADRRTWSP